MPDKPIGPIGNQGIAPPAGFILSSSKACVAPEMEGQARRHEANAQPAGEVRANSRKARTVRLLKKGQKGSRSQPHQRAEYSIEPKRCGHSVALSSNRVCPTMIRQNPSCLNRLRFLPNSSHKVHCTEPARDARC